MHVRCPHCQNPIELVDDAEFSEIQCVSCGSSFSLLEETITHQKAEAQTIGHFALVEQVGLGAFGSVWKAHDTKLDRTVAVKIPRKGQLDPTETEQFLREARSAAQLKHPNIVSVHEVGQTYIVSDFVEGLPLSSWLTARQLTFYDAAELSAKVAEALQHAHEVGVIHRDLKPSNIMLDGDGEPHIMDFGLAKREAGEITMTMDGKVLGTPAYMSPEQAKGKAHTADRRSDVYSLGVILFELLTGERPFRGDYRMLVHQVVNEEPQSPRRLKTNLPRDLETICLKCLEKDPSQRYHSAREFAEELRRFVRGEPISARPITRPARAWRWCRRNPVVASLVSAVAGLLLILAVAGPLVATRQAALREAEAEQRRQAEGLAEENQALAETERRKSQELERQLRISTAMRLAAESQAAQNEFPIRSLLLAIEAAEVTRRRDEPIVRMARETLQNAVQIVGGWPLVSGHRIKLCAVSPDSHWLVTTAENEGVAQLWDLTAADRTTGSVMLQGHEGPIHSLVFSSDSDWLVTGSEDATARIWHLGGRDPTSSIELRGHLSRVGPMAISPDGRWLATGSSDESVRIWDLKSPDAIATTRVLDGHGNGISAIQISPNGRWLVTKTLGTAAEVRLWDLTDPTASARVLRGDSQTSPDGRWLITASDQAEGGTELWDLTADEPDTTSRVLFGQESRLGQVTVSGDGHWLAMNVGGSPHLWDLGRDGTGSRRELRGHHRRTSQIAISSDGRWLVTASRQDNTARLWNLTTGNPDDSSLVLSGHESYIVRTVISPDGRWLFTGSFDKTARLWDLEAADPATSFLELRGHDFIVGSVVFSPNCRWLVTVGGVDGTARLWNLGSEYPSNSPTVLHHGGRRSRPTASIGSEGRWLVIGSDDNSVRLWNLTSSDPAASVRVLRGHTNTVGAVTIGPNSRWLVTGSDDKTVRLWDLNADPAVSRHTLVGHEGAIGSLAISPNSRWLVTGSDDKTARVWDMEHPAEAIHVFRGHEDAIRFAVFNADGRFVVTTGRRDPTARLWGLNVADPANSPRVLRGHRVGIENIAMSQDGRWLATGGLDGVARVWDLHAANPAASSRIFPHPSRDNKVAVELSLDGRWLVTIGFDVIPRLWDLHHEDAANSPQMLEGHTRAAIFSTQISRDSGWLLTGGYDNSARLWDLNAENPSLSSRKFQHLRGITREFGSVRVAMSQDGRWLATGGGSTVRLWDLVDQEAEESFVELRGHESSLGGFLTFTSNGRWLVTKGVRTARLWHLDADSLIKRARSLAGRELSPEERKQYLLD